MNPNQDYQTPKLIIEFTDADDSRLKSSYTNMDVESDGPLPIPHVGDTVCLMEPYVEENAIFLRVEWRRFTYGEDYTHVQLFCRECDERGPGEITLSLKKRGRPQS